MWKKLKKRKIQRLLKGSFPPYWGGVLFSNAKKEPKRLNRFTLLRSNSFAIGKPTHPSKVCFFIPIRTIGKEIDTVLFGVPALMGKHGMMK